MAERTYVPTDPRGEAPKFAVDGLTKRDDEISVLDVVNLLLRHRRIIFGLPILLAVVFVAVRMLSSRTFTATASLVPEGPSSGASTYAGLAAQIGINVPDAEPSQSPGFYALLLQSNEILESAVTTRYAFRAGADSISGSLVELLRAKGVTPRQRIESAMQKLDADLDVNVDRETGVVKLKVHTHWAALSYLITNRLVGLVNEFNINRRQSQARSEGDFAAQQVAAAQHSLREAEDSLQNFLQRNRTYATDPQLVFQHDRLQRSVTMRQDLYTTLSQSYQQARIEEARNTPVITIVESPRIPARPDSRGTLLQGILGLVVGGMLGLVIAAGHEFIGRSDGRDAEVHQEFAALRADAVRDLRRISTFWRSPKHG